MSSNNNNKRARLENQLEEYLLPGDTLIISKTATIRKTHVKGMIDTWGESAKLFVNESGDIEIDTSAEMTPIERQRYCLKSNVTRPKEIESKTLSELVAASDRMEWEEVLLALARCFDLVDEDPFVKKLRNTGVRVAVGMVSCMYLSQLRSFISCEYVDDVHIFPSNDQNIHILVDVKKREPSLIQH